MAAAPDVSRRWRSLWDDLPLGVKGLLAATVPIALLLLALPSVVSIGLEDAESTATVRRAAWSAVLGATAAGGATWLFLAGLVRRIHRLETDARRLASGRPLDGASDAGHDEIGRLDRTLRLASALLLEREHALRAAADEIRDLYESAPCGYHSLDPDGLIVRMNATELQWLGYAAGEVVGAKRLPELITEASRATFAANFPEFKRTGALRDVEFDMVRKDGSVLPVSVSASAIVDADGRYVASRSTVFDITARREAAGMVAALNERLQRELDAQAMLNRELEAFSYSVSHDLRAPLRGIDGFAQALAEDCEAQLDAAGREHLRRIRAAAQRMGLLIDDLLTLSRISRAGLRLENVDVSAMAADVATRLAAEAPGRAVDWRIAPGIEVAADRPLLGTAIENLLGNAWKFTARRARAEIAVEPCDAPADQTAFVVRDNGAGFDMKHADRLFGAFQRLHSAAEYPGTGVGLAIVQRVVARHGGQVRAHAVPDEGAAFTVVLPAGRGES